MSSTQLNATASFGGTNVPGTFEYTPAAGETLEAGTQALLVAFFPEDSVYYTSAGGSVDISVNPNSSSPPQLIYSYTIAGAGGASGYAGNSNLLSYNDSVTGAWTFKYDSLNRAVAGMPASGNATNGGNNLCWPYDPFGNRTAQTSQSTACPTLPSVPTATVTYSTNNQISWVSGIGSGVFQYDAAGNGGEGRICAVKNIAVGTMTQYIYDTDGNRVAKGMITSWSCDNGINSTTHQPNNGFRATSSYVFGPSNEPLTETDGQGNWVHTNAYAAGAIIATYDLPTAGNPALHFQLTDWLGSRRVQTDISGNVEETYASLPFGDGFAKTVASGAPPTADDATEHHFTGKERDTESGNDYFGARYYASSMGRWLSPDWSGPGDPVPYANFEDPQSLNLYSYVGNNPLSRTDPLGHYHCDPDTSSTNANGDLVVTAGACHSDWSDFALAGAAWGHHFVDQAVTKANQAWNSLAGQFFRRWSTGPLKPGGPHSGFPTPARLSQQQVQKIIQDVVKSSGKNMSEWGPEEINQAKEEVANAGGDTGAFLKSIAADNPAARTAQQDTGDIMQAAQKAWQATQNAASQVGPAIEEGIEDIQEECGGGGCIPPP